MEKHSDIVPKWIRILLGLLAIANIAFGVSCYFDTSALFQNSNVGIDLLGLGAKYASYEFASRNLAIGLALMIVTLKGVPESLAIVTIIRALIEFQTVIIAVVNNNLKAGSVVAIVVLAIEVFIVATLFNVISKRDKN